MGCFAVGMCIHQITLVCEAYFKAHVILKHPLIFGEGHDTFHARKIRKRSSQLILLLRIDPRLGARSDVFWFSVGQLKCHNKLFRAVPLTSEPWSRDTSQRCQGE